MASISCNQILGAYATRKATKASTQKPPESPIRIYTHSRYVIEKPGKFDQTLGFLFSSSKSSNTAKLVLPTGTPEVLQKLSSKESFPSAYKTRYDPNAVNAAGDLVSKEERGNKNSRQVLAGISVLNACPNYPGRASDFVSEVKWRMQLRECIQ
jgi:hypothetical protein